MSNIILAIDCSIDHCSIAIYKNKCIYSISEECKQKHTTRILPMIQKILFQTQTEFKKLNYVSFAKGPGNFTSIRIAASIAQSLSLSLKIPIISISTLAIMAEKAWRKNQKKQVIIAMNAKKTEIYWAKYTRNKKSIWIGEDTESVLNKQLIKDKINNLKKKWTLIGNGWEEFKYKNFLNLEKTNIFFPSARDIIPFVLLKIKNKKESPSIEGNIKEGNIKEGNINYLYDQF